MSVRSAIARPLSTPNSASVIAVVVILNVVATAAFLVLPAFVAGAQESLKFSVRDIGFLSAVGMAGSMISALVAKFWVRRLAWPSAARSALIGLVCADALSLVFQERWSFLALQCVAGFFAGSLYSLTLIILSDGKHPDRSFGFAVAAQVVFQVAGLLAGPSLLRLDGINALLWGFVILSAGSLLLAGYLPICGRSVSAAVTFAGVLHLKTLLALMGCLFFLLNTACYWTYINSIGQHAGLNEWQIAKSLAIGTSAGLFGALLASWCADRFGRNGPLTIGTLIIIAAAWLLAAPMSLWQFTVSNVLFNFAWNYSLAYQYAAVNAADASGHGVALAPAFHTTGAAAGPAIAALLIAPGEYASVLWLIDVGVILSMGCFLASSLAAPRTANLV